MKWRVSDLIDLRDLAGAVVLAWLAIRALFGLWG